MFIMWTCKINFSYSIYFFPTEIAKDTREIQKVYKYQTQLSGDSACLKTKTGIIFGLVTKNPQQLLSSAFPSFAEDTTSY